MRDCKEELKKNINGRVCFDEPFSRYTTFNIGGLAKAFVIPSDEEDLKKLLSISKKFSIPYYILGNGSNLLVSDRGVRGIVIKLNGPFSHFYFRGGMLTAGAGAEISTLRREAQKRGLSGLEFTAGIPGTLGGAIIMNAGAWGSDMSGIVRRVEIMDKRGRIGWLGPNIGFVYRSAPIKKGAIILKAEIALIPADASAIKEKTSALLKKRRLSQPIGERCAGSIFKNPDKMSAGYLIEKAGFKGKSFGRAYVSPLHANFIINRDCATASEVMRLIKMIQKKVFRQFGIGLELELVIW